MDTLELEKRRAAAKRAAAYMLARNNKEFEEKLKGLCFLYGKTLKVEKQKRIFKDRNGNLKEYEATVYYQVNML